MVKQGFPSDIVQWYCYYLNNRQVRIELKGASGSRALTRGTPQGGVLSPMAWNLAFDELLEDLNQGPTTAIGYADDGLLLITGSDPVVMAADLQPYLDKAVAWGRRFRLKFSQEKTVAMLFSRKRSPAAHPTLRLDGSPIAFVKEVKYLGLTITPALRWGKHISQKIGKCKGVLMRYRAAVGVAWGPRPGLQAWVMRSVVIPTLSYAAHVWGWGNLAPFRAKLNKLSRLALSGLGPMRRNTPTAGLEMITGFPPLDLVIKKTGALTYNRINRGIRRTWDGMGKSANGHLLEWDRFVARNCPKLGPVDSTVRTFHWDLPIQEWQEGVECDHEIFLQQVYQRVDKDPSFHCRITGGARSPMSGMLAGLHTQPLLLFMGYIIGKLRRLGRRLTLCFVLPSPPALLTRNYAKSRTLQWLYAMVEQGSARVFWRNPSGEQERVLLQDLAREAHRSNRIIRLPSYRSTRQNANLLDGWVTSTWHEIWQGLSSCRMTKRWLPRPSSQVAREALMLNRDDFGRVAQVITGHDWFARHRARLGEEPTEGICRLCGLDVEEAAHLFWDCPALEEERATFLDVSKENMPWTVCGVLQFLNSPSVKLLLEQDD